MKNQLSLIRLNHELQFRDGVLQHNWIDEVGVDKGVEGTVGAGGDTN